MQAVRPAQAAGTTGSVAGLVAGLAAAHIDAEVHAIRVADNPFASEEKLRKLIEKTVFILNRYDPSFKAEGWQEQLVWRDDCERTRLTTQRGNWKYPRAGWCPGDKVLPVPIDVGAKPTE